MWNPLSAPFDKHVFTAYLFPKVRFFPEDVPLEMLIWTLWLSAAAILKLNTWQCYMCYIKLRSFNWLGFSEWTNNFYGSVNNHSTGQETGITALSHENSYDYWTPHLGHNI